MEVWIVVTLCLFAFLAYWNWCLHKEIGELLFAIKRIDRDRQFASEAVAALSHELACLRSTVNVNAAACIDRERPTQKATTSKKRR